MFVEVTYRELNVGHFLGYSIYSCSKQNLASHNHVEQTRLKSSLSSDAGVGAGEDEFCWCAAAAASGDTACERNGNPSRARREWSEREVAERERNGLRGL